MNKVVFTETTTTCDIPILAPRTGCEGQALEHPKVVGWEPANRVVPVEILCGFTHEELAKAGYVYAGIGTTSPSQLEELAPPHEGGSPKKSASAQDFWGEVPWEILRWIALIGAALLLFFLLVGLLRRLYDWAMASRMGSGQDVPPPHITDQQTPPNPPRPGMVLIPEDGIYLGRRGVGEAFEGSIYPSRPQARGGH